MTIIPNGGNDPKRTHDIGGSPRPARVARRQGAPDETPGRPTPALQMSAQAERFVSLRSRLEALEPPQTERVERLRQLVAEGRYHPDSAAVAAAMLADPATAAALGFGPASPEASW